MNPQVDDFLSKAENWRDEMERLRAIVLDCGLEEEIKWGIPVYTLHGKNIVSISPFKNYAALGFFNGVLLYDAEGILSQPGDVQVGRLVRFTSVKEIAKQEPVLKAYIYEAIEVEKAGVKPKLKTMEDYPLPEELQNKLDEFPAFRTAFNALTQGRQKGYIIYFSQPKQSKTREARIEKYVPNILAGKGLTDDYNRKDQK